MRTPLEVEVRDQPESDETYRRLRPLLFSIAYGIVSSASEAEDIVQEAFLRLHRERSQGVHVESSRAWLSTVTTRLAINHVRSARARREAYIGTWLPEPVLTDPGPDASQHAEISDALSMALLVLLESLNPIERAVFLLREVFDFGYDEIAEIVGKSVENCRQIAVRARRHVAERRPRFDATRERGQELARRFFAAAAAGDTDGLLGLLAADVVAYGDGGGKAPSIPRPASGRDQVGRLCGEFPSWLAQLDAVSMRFAEVNGQPGALFLDHGERAVLVVSLEIADDLVHAIQAVSNPDKLRHLTAGLGGREQRGPSEEQ